MAKLDELKEELGVLKFWLGIVVATLLALIGWLATNYQTTEVFMLIAGFACVFVCLILIYVLNKKIKMKIKKIGEA